ncbi:MAG: nicotinate (nicotinamide) nucleotide adenylyltransferase [Thainema sp.]
MPISDSQLPNLSLAQSSTVDFDSSAAVGILGGTFDPVHQGHLALAIAAIQQADLDQLLWVPDPHPPHKAKSKVTSLEHRINMIQSAIAPLPRQQVWQRPQDHESSAPSFAISTLNALQQAQPNGRWHWILGLDAFCTLPKWYRSEELVSQCQWVVAPRSESTSKAAEEQCRQVVAHFASCDRRVHYQLLNLDSFRPIPAASSVIRRQYQNQTQRSPDHPSDHHASGHRVQQRNQIEDGQIDQWLPLAVQRYIQQHQLYSSRP